MSIDDYVAELMMRAAMQREIKAQQNAEIEAAQHRAMEEARTYMAGLPLAETIDAAGTR